MHRADPIEPGGGTRSLTGDCEATGCHEAAYQRVTRNLGVGQAESRLVCRDHLAAALAWAAQPPPRASLPVTSARGGGIGLRPEFRAPREAPKVTSRKSPKRTSEKSFEAAAPESRSASDLPAPTTPAEPAPQATLPIAEGQSTSNSGQPTSNSEIFVTPDLTVDPVVPPGRCRLLGCATPSNVRGLCLPHYDLARRKGQLDELALPPIPRGRGTRFQRPAESAPSTRPQRAPRTRRAGAAAAAAPRHEGEALRAIWVALGSPELAQSESMDLEILRAAEQRLRLDAQLASRITELEEDGVRLRSQLLQSQQENSRLETLKTSVLSSIPPTTLAFDGYNLDVLIRAALDAERSRVNDLRGALAEIVGRDLDGQADADLIAGAQERIRYLSDGWRVAAEVRDGLRERLLTEQARVLALTGELRGQVDRLIGQDALWLILAPAPDESLAAAALRLRLDLARREGVSRG